MQPIEPIVTHVAHAGWDDHNYFGYKLFRDLAGSTSYSALLALAVTGQRGSADVAQMLDDVAAVLALGEPRIWPLKLTRLGSAYGRTLPGILVGNLCFESHVLGPMTIGKAAELIVELKNLSDDDARHRRIVECKESKRVAGFGVAFRDVDERLEALRICVRRKERASLPHWEFAEALWAKTRGEHGLIPNVGSAIGAVLLDCGFSPEQIGPLGFALMQSVMLANAFEGAAQAPEVLRRLPDDAIEYVGQPARISPRARAVRSVSAQRAPAETAKA